MAGHGATESLALRPLAESDLPAAQALSAAVGWPHRVEDWRFVHGLGAGVALERDGALVGTAMTWRYGADAAALGMVIVAPGHQGKGFGRRLLAAALEEFGARRRVLLHATEAALPLYRGLGFRARGTVRQHQGAAFSVGLVAPPGERIRPVGRGDAPALAALDAEASGMERGPVIAGLLEAADGVVPDRGGEAAGFALLRRFGRGHVIGPVVAPDAEAAKALIGHWLGSRSGQFLRIDVPEEAELRPWLAGLGLAEVDKAVPMLRGEAPAPGSRARAFALVNQALG